MPISAVRNLCSQTGNVEAIRHLFRIALLFSTAPTPHRAALWTEIGRRATRGNRSDADELDNRRRGDGDGRWTT
jgi:hypothetical protein